MASLVDASKKGEFGQFKEYTLQLRQELGARLATLNFNAEGPLPSLKLWTMYNKRKFMSLNYN